MKRKLLFLLFAMWICSGNAQSSDPEIVSSAGETFQGNSMQIGWTLGEVAIATIQNSSQQLTQGFHQPNYMITSVIELPAEIGQIHIFPNPTSDIIKMELNFDQIREVKIQLIDLNGRLIWTREQIGSQIEQVKDLTNLSDGNYFLNFLIDGNKYSQTFKIQKLN